MFKNKYALLTFLFIITNIFSFIIKGDSFFIFDSRASATVEKDICQDTTTLTGTQPDTSKGETGQWSVVFPSENDITFENDTVYKTLVEGFKQTQDAVIKWEVYDSGNNEIPDKEVLFSITYKGVADADIKEDTLSICDSSVVIHFNKKNSDETQSWNFLKGDGKVNLLSDTTAKIEDLSKDTNKLERVIRNDDTTCVSRDTVEIVNNLPTRADAGDDSTSCSSTFHLHGNSYETDENAFWSGPGNIVDSSDPGTLVKELENNNTYQYIWQISKEGCTSKDTVNIEVKPFRKANAGEDTIICTDSYTLNANNPPVGNNTGGKWAVIEGNGDFENKNSPSSEVYNLAEGKNLLEWTLFSEGCNDSKDTVKIINDKPTEANAGPDTVICRDNITLYGNIPTQGTGYWRWDNGVLIDSVETGGENPDVNSLKKDTTKLFYSISYNKNCPSSLDSVKIINNKVTTAEAPPDTIVCKDSVLLKAQEVNYGQGNWFERTGHLSFSDADSVETWVNNLDEGLNKILWEVTKGKCRSVDSMLVDNQTPTKVNAGKDSIICKNEIKLYSEIPTQGQGIWYLNNNPIDTVTKDNKNPLVKNLPLNSNDFVMEVKHGICNAYRDTVEIYNLSPLKAKAGKDTIICQDKINLYANDTVDGKGTGKWKIGEFGGANIDNPVDPETEITPTHGKSQLVWTIKREKNSKICKSSDTLIINDQKPSKANISASDTIKICDSTQFLNANDPNIGDGKWTTDNKQVSINVIGENNAEFSNLPKDTTTVYWTVTNNKHCTNKLSVDSVKILNNLPVKPKIYTQNPHEICTDSTSLKAAAPIGNEEGFWISPPDVTIKDSSDTLINVSGIPKDTNIFVWQLNKKGCDLKDSIKVINNRPHQPSLSSDSVCSDSIILPEDKQLGAKEAGTWKSVIVNGIDGADSIKFIEPQKYAAINLNLGKNYYEWRVDKGKCSLKDTIFIRNDLPSSPQFINDYDKVVCSDTIKLPGKEPEQGNPEWVLVVGKDIFTPSEHDAKALLNLGANIFDYSISTRCGSSVSKEFKVENARPSVANGGKDIDSCINNYTFNPEDVTQGSGRWKLQDSNLDTTMINQEKMYVDNLKEGDNIFYYIVSTSECPSSIDTVVFNNKNPSPAKITSSDTSVCLHDFLIEAQKPKQGKAQWISNRSETEFSNSTNHRTSFNSLAKDTNKIKWKVSHDNCPPNVDSINIINNKVSSAETISDKIDICKDSVQIKAKKPLKGESGEWIIDSSSIDINTHKNILTIKNKDSSITKLKDIYPGIDINLTWKISKHNCSNTDQVVLKNYQPDSIDAGNNFETCFIEDIIKGSDPKVQLESATGTWHSQNENICFSYPSNPDTCLTSIDVDTSRNILVSKMNEAGNYNFIYEINAPASNCKTLPKTIRDTMTITRQSNIDLGVHSITDSLCNKTEFNLSKLNVPDINSPNAYSVWDSLNTLKSPIAPEVDNINEPDARVYNLRPGSKTYLKWKVTKGECVGVVDINLENFHISDQAKVQDKINVCEKDHLQIRGNKPVNGIASWEADTDSDLINYSFNNNILNITSLNIGSSRFIYKIKNGVCPATTDTTEVINYKDISQISAGEDDTICGNSYQLNASYKPYKHDFNGVWEVDKGDGHINNPENKNTLLSDLNPDNHQLKWKVINGVCSDSAILNLYVKPEIEKPEIYNPDTTVCSDSLMISANQISGLAKGKWESNNDTIIFSNADSNLTKVNNLEFGSNIIFWKAYSKGCKPLTDKININNYKPGYSDISLSDTSICKDNINISASIKGNGKGFWKANNEKIDFIPSDTASPVSVVNLQKGKNNIIYSVKTVSSCKTRNDTVVLINNEPGSAFAGNDDSICNKKAYQLNANKVSVGKGKWSLPRYVNVSDYNDNRAVVENLKYGENHFIWKIKNKNCISQDSVKIVANQKPNDVYAGSSKQIFKRETRLNARSPAVGNGKWKIIKGKGDFENKNDPSTKVTGLTSGENIFKWQVENGACPPSSDSVIIKVEKFTIPEGFSPNNDGTNDYFVIEGLNNFNNSELVIYNRWGEEVYSNSSYKNNWNGRNNKGEKLSSDTYFYSLKLSNGEKYSGHVIIKRR